MSSRWVAVVMSLIGSPVVCLLGSAAGAGEQPEPGPPPTEPPAPMASFARMENSEWLLGTVQSDAWSWGPAKRSMRVVTTGQGGDGKPWSELTVYYWDPGRGQVRLLGFHPDIPGVGRGVASGTIVFDGDTVTTAIDLYQRSAREGKPRKMGGRWAFDGPDAYHEVLLEDAGNGLVPLAAWDYVRAKEGSRRPAPNEAEAPAPSENIAAFERLMGRWTASEEQAHGGAIRFHTDIAWVEYLDVVTIRVIRQPRAGRSTLALDAYLYHHIGTGSLHCLALSASGSVYEGDVAVLEDGALELDLMGFEQGRSSAYTVRIGAEADGRLRQRVWRLDSDQRTLVLDVVHERVDPGQDESAEPEASP